MSISRFIALTGLVAGSITSLSAHAAIIYRTVAIASTQAPGTPSGALFRAHSAPSPRSTRSATSSSGPSCSPTPAGVVLDQNDQGIWSRKLAHCH